VSDETSGSEATARGTAETQREFEQLRGRHERLRDQRIQAETRLEGLEEDRRRLEAEAVERWGTADVEALEKRLAEMQAANRRRLDDFRRALDAVESELEAIETEADADDAEPMAGRSEEEGS